jgi:UDP-N-acetylglucosamine 1-carboxyvinyltransferase
MGTLSNPQTAGIHAPKVIPTHDDSAYTLAELEKELADTKANFDRVAQTPYGLSHPEFLATYQANIDALQVRIAVKKNPKIIMVGGGGGSNYTGSYGGTGTVSSYVVGVPSLGGVSHTVAGDRIEAGTLLASAAMLEGGDVKVTGIVPEHSGVVLEKFREAGLDVEVGEDWARVRRPAHFRGLRVKTAPFPGYPTDMQAQIMALMTQADGVSAISENIFENRFMHVPELVRLGADIEIEGKTALVNGPARLSGAPVMATDLRASACLVLAGLAASGETRVRRVYHIDRGYERIEEKFAQLGGRIRREAE